MLNLEPTFPNCKKIIALAVCSLSLTTLVACNGGGVTPSTSGGTGASSSGGSSSGTSSSSGSSSSSSSSSGGGPTVTASPYILFSSGYIGYATQTNGAYLHSAQSGDVYTGFGGNLIYGSYSSPQPDMNRTGLYVLQTQAANGSANPTTSGDYQYIAVLAPGDSTADISQAATLLIQMGNSIVPSSTGGHANVFTVDINNAHGSTAATGDCSYNQTLTVVGSNVTLTALGARTYAIPLSSFTCSIGTLSSLQSSGITTVAVKIVGNNNPSMVSGEFDTIVVGTIGFSGAMSTADMTTLNTI